MPWRWVKSPLIAQGLYRFSKVDALLPSGPAMTPDPPRLPNADDTVRRSRMSIDAEGRVSFDGALVMCHTLVFSNDFSAVDADPDCTTLAEFNSRDRAVWGRVRIRGRLLSDIIDQDVAAEKARVHWRRRGNY